MAFDLYVWASPRDLDDDRAATMVEVSQAEGGDPARSPFEPSTDIGWFYRELIEDLPALDAASDAVPRETSVPIWMSGTDEAPARVVAVRLRPAGARETLETIFGLATKYDLVVFDARNRRVHLPLAMMAEYASSTFWPAGAIRAAVAGIVGAAIAIGGWVVTVPVLSAIAIVVGVFLVLMAVLTFVDAGRRALRGRRGTESSPPR